MKANRDKLDLSRRSLGRLICVASERDVAEERRIFDPFILRTGGFHRYYVRAVENGPGLTRIDRPWTWPLCPPELCILRLAQYCSARRFDQYLILRGTDVLLKAPRPTSCESLCKARTVGA